MYPRFDIVKFNGTAAWAVSLLGASARKLWSNDHNARTTIDRFAGNCRLYRVAFSVAPVGLDYDFTPETKSAFAKAKGSGKSGSKGGGKRRSKSKGGDGDGTGLEPTHKGKTRAPVST